MSSVTVRTPSQAFEFQLATRSDRTRLLGKTLVSSAASLPGPAGININPSVLGARAASLALLFARWKINRLVLKVLTLPASQVAVAGFLDDSITSADVPTSMVGVLQLRCSVSY